MISIYIIIFSVLLSSDFNMVDLYSQNEEYDMEFKAIQSFSDQTDSEFLWRIARAYFNQAEQENDQQKKNELFYQSYDYSKQALDLDPNSAKVNHYYAVLHGQIGLIEGTKQKIINSYGVLKHGQIAVEIDPDYDNTHHLLGRLNFELANLSWLERNFASLIYETPPEGSFEKAESYFQSAISLNPKDIRHWLWLGKTYIKLNQKDKAHKALLTASSLKAKNEKDKNNIEEAELILNSFK